MGISYQKGWVRPRGKKWHGCFRRTELDPETNQSKLVTHSFVLGSKAEMSKSQAREKLEDEITKLGGRSTGDQAVVNGAVTFEWFVKNRYLPLKEGDWREETAKVKKYLIQADLVDAFGDYRLENFDKVVLQTHLNKLAKTHSRDRVLQIRSYMRAIFAEAVDQDFIPKDPARTVRPPANLREVDKTTLSWDQLRAALERLGDIRLRDWILMKLDMSNALRPSELFPLRWRCFLEHSRVLDIKETVYKGKIRPFGKTKSSLTKVPIADVLANEIVEYREELRKEGQRHVPGCVHVSGAIRGTDGFKQLSPSRPAQTRQGTRAAETDVPGHPPHHCHPGQDQGTSQGHPGADAAQPAGDDHGGLHAVVGKRGADGDQLDSRRVGGHGNRRTRSSAAGDDIWTGPNHPTEENTPFGIVLPGSSRRTLRKEGRRRP